MRLLVQVAQLAWVAAMPRLVTLVMLCSRRVPLRAVGRAPCRWLLAPVMLLPVGPSPSQLAAQLHHLVWVAALALLVAQAPRAGVLNCAAVRDRLAQVVPCPSLLAWAMAAVLVATCASLVVSPPVLVAPWHCQVGVVALLMVAQCTSVVVGP